MATSLSLSLSLSCCSHLEHRASVKRFVSLQFLNLIQSVGLLGWGISPSQGRYLYRKTETQNKHRQTAIPSVGFDPTIPMFERAKTVHALDHAAAVIRKRRVSSWESPLKDCGKPRMSTVGAFGVLAEISSRHIPDTSENYYGSSQPAQSIVIKCGPTSDKNEFQQIAQRGKVL
jgi:hypothetical protein